MLALGIPTTARAEGGALSGSGVYRPFTLSRQIRLATGYILEPVIPEKAKIRHAYSLPHLKQLGKVLVDAALSRGALQLAARVEDGNGDLALTAVDGLPESGIGTLLNLPDDELEIYRNVYVLSTEDLDPSSEERMITWDADEEDILVPDSGPLLEFRNRVVQSVIQNGDRGG